MTGAQRRVVIAVCVIVGLSLLMAAGLAFLVEPMSEALGLSDVDVEDILAIPSVAALLAVFTAGHLGDRFGHRRTLAAGSLLFSIGSAVLALANGTVMVEISLAICAAAAITVQIVGVSLLQQRTHDGPAQVSAFTTYGAVFPVAFLILPVLTAGVLGITDWRIVPVLWVLAGVIMLGVALTIAGREHPPQTHSDWASPMLAGISLAGFARAFSELGQIGFDPTPIAVGITVGLLAAIGCLLIMHRHTNPGLSFTPVSSGVLRILLGSVGLVSFIGLLTFLTITLEYFYDLTPFEASLAMIPAQLGAVLGAKVVASLAIKRWGGLLAARVLVAGIAIPVLGLLIFQTSTPAWYLIAIATLCAASGMAALTVLNTEVMRRAPESSTGAVSSFRTASSSLGAALGVGVFGTLILSSVQLDDGESAVSAAELAQLAGNLRVVGVIAAMVAAGSWLLLGRASHRTEALNVRG